MSHLGRVSCDELSTHGRPFANSVCSQITSPGSSGLQQRQPSRMPNTLQHQSPRMRPGVRIGPYDISPSEHAIALTVGFHWPLAQKGQPPSYSARASNPPSLPVSLSAQHSVADSTAKSVTVLPTMSRQLSARQSSTVLCHLLDT